MALCCQNLGLMLAATLFFASDAMAERKLESVYSDISTHACKKTVDEKLTGAATMVCGGVGGFKLHVLDDDERSSVSVVDPDGKILPLEYWEVVTHSFSSLGARVEWRVAMANGKLVPVALIVRVNAVDQSDPYALKEWTDWRQ